MKTHVLMISRQYPATHPKAGEPTDFEQLIEAGTKIHTLRDSLRWISRIEEINQGKARLSVRVWSNSPYNRLLDDSKMIEIASFEKGEVGCELAILSRGTSMPMSVTIENQYIPIEKFCFNDGLSVKDAEQWFFPQKPKGVFAQSFMGVVIHFTSFRYVS